MKSKHSCYVITGQTGRKGHNLTGNWVTDFFKEYYMPTQIYTVPHYGRPLSNTIIGFYMYD